jgi:response regulator RpfG family c-di-GMP phosphodiesterase
MYGSVHAITTPALPAERPRILCVDDEPLILDALQRCLRRHFDVVTASDGATAILALEACPAFAVIVSDMRMPQMSGAELLSAARRLAPDTVRIVLSGYADAAAMDHAVNDSDVFLFLSKPCPPDQLRRHLADAVREHLRIIGLHLAAVG